MFNTERNKAKEDLPEGLDVLTPVRARHERTTPEQTEWLVLLLALKCQYPFSFFRPHKFSCRSYLV